MTTSINFNNKMCIAWWSLVDHSVRLRLRIREVRCEIILTRVIKLSPKTNDDVKCPRDVSWTLRRWSSRCEIIIVFAGVADWCVRAECRQPALSISILADGGRGSSSSSSSWRTDGRTDGKWASWRSGTGHRSAAADVTSASSRCERHVRATAWRPKLTGGSSADHPLCSSVSIEIRTFSRQVVTD